MRSVILGTPEVFLFTQRGQNGGLQHVKGSGREAGFMIREHVYNTM